MMGRKMKILPVFGWKWVYVKMRMKNGTNKKSEENVKDRLNPALIVKSF